MKSLFFVRAISLTFALLLAACSGSGTHVIPSATTGTAATMTFSIKIPDNTTQSAAIRPEYVSPNTGSVAFTLTSNNGVPETVPPTVVALSGGACSGSPKTCTATVNEPTGTDVFKVQTFASSDGSGAALSVNTVTKTIATGTNSVAVTLNGIVASLVYFAVFQNTCHAVHGCTDQVVLNALDASGATIVGPGNYVTASGATDTIQVNYRSTTIPAGNNFATGETITNAASNCCPTSPAANNLYKVFTSGFPVAGNSQTFFSIDSQGYTASWTLNYIP